MEALVLMSTTGRVVLKIIGALGIVMLICCVTLTNGRAAGQGGQQQKQNDDNPNVTCPDVSLLSISNLQVSGIDALKRGIFGLPCDAQQEGPPKSPPDARKLQHGFDYYSWLTFIALNSPKNGKLISSETRPAWEDYKQLPDVMLPGGATPDGWTDDNLPHDKDDKAAPCADKFKPGMMIVHMEMEETYNEPFKSGPLFDQNGNYALFTIFMNQQMFQYIKNHGLYSRVGQEEYPADIDFPSADNAGGKLGAIMIKASWKLMKPGVDFGSNVQSPRYHMVDALLYRPRSADSCRQVKLGLIGFHVGHKTVTRHQWIWTTFEHIKNVPTENQVNAPGGISPDEQYSFYNPRCKECPINQTPPGSWDPDTRGLWHPDAPGWVPFEHTSKFKSQIVRTGRSRIFPDEDDVKTFNDAFHAWPQISNTVWKNYNLINTQWPSDFSCSTNSNPGGLQNAVLPDATCAPFPTFLANTTLETFSQPQQKSEITDKDQDEDQEVPLATSSCISCHNNATTQHRPAKRSDFTFILEKAQ
jgi:hypothetical protein